jgi:signal transduction histidine kinase
LTLSIRTRLIALYCLIFAVLFAALGLSVYRSIHRQNLARIDSRLQQYAYNIEHELAGDIPKGDFPDYRDLAEVLPPELSRGSFALFGGGSELLLGDSALSELIPSSEPDAPLFRDWRRVSSVARVVAMVIEPLPEKEYLLILATPLEEIREEEENLGWLLALLIPAGLLLAGVASWLIVGFAFRPLAAMIRSAERISTSNLDDRLPIPEAKDEIRELGTVLNQMIERLHGALQTERRFAADASHQLRTPLAVIQTELDFIERHIDSESAKESLKIGKEEIKRLSKLTANLLSLTRLDSGAEPMRICSFDLNQAALDCAERLSPLAEQKGIRFNLQMSDPLTIEGDRVKLELALTSILENAVKFAPHESRVTISVQNSVAEKQAAQISVVDEGPGISDNDLPFIFDRFYRSTEANIQDEGSGLGLAIAREIIVRHSGEIRAENVPGAGARFILALPVKLK